MEMEVSWWKKSLAFEETLLPREGLSWNDSETTLNCATNCLAFLSSFCRGNGRLSAHEPVSFAAEMRQLRVVRVRKRLLLDCLLPVNASLKFCRGARRRLEEQRLEEQ